MMVCGQVFQRKFQCGLRAWQMALSSHVLAMAEAVEDDQ
jgi:hypothetical protein